MKNRFVVMLLIVLMLSSFIFAQAVEETPSSEINVVASTTWVASYAQIAGLKNVHVIAPGTMIHPPEYEIKVSDIQKVMKADYFIFAGYEAMMQSISENVSPDTTTEIKISTDNYYENIALQARKIAKIAGTEVECEKNLKALKDLITSSAKKLEASGVNKIPIYCHFYQTPLATDLGLNIVDSFGPSPLTSKQIKEASDEQFQLVIDNVHNPIASVILDVSPNSKIVTWRNFPINLEENSLYNLIKQNIDTLL